MAQITVTWEAQGADGHRVYIRDTGDESWILVTPTGLPAGVLTYTIHWLDEGVAYDVGVSAWDGSTESPIVELAASLPPEPEPEPPPEPPEPPLRAKDLDVRAEGSGMYRVFVGGVPLSQHTSERRAEKKAIDAKIEAGRSVAVFYDHDYKVWIEVK